MQHSALRRRTPPATMRHRAEAAKSSAAPRPPVPPTAQTVTGLSEPFFCFFAANLPPLRRFCRRGAAITVGTATATAQQAQRNNPFGSSPSRCLRCEQPRPKTTPRRPSIAKQTRSAAGKKGASDGNTPTFSRLSATFSSKSPCTVQCAPATPTISPPHSVFAGENTIRPHVFCLQICIFAHSSLSLRQYMSAKLRTLRRQVALAWILLLALLPQLVVKTFHYHDSAVPTEHIGLNADGQGAECIACLRAAAAATARDGQHAGENGTPAPALAHRTHRPCHRHHHLPGQVPGDKHDNCSICHFVPAPCTVPTLPQFCFFVSTAETPFLSDQPSIAHTVIARAVLRGPPTV